MPTTIWPGYGLRLEMMTPSQWLQIVSDIPKVDKKYTKKN